MINEVLMSQGSWDITLRVDSPLDLWQDLGLFGLIVITPQAIQLNVNILSDANILTVARYVGPLLKKEIDNWRIKLFGTSMVWWLGDDEGKGQAMDTAATLSGSNLSASISAVLPTSVNLGTITEPGGTHSAVYQWGSRLEAIRSICAEMSSEYRVNNNGTIDAGLPEDVYNIDDPEVVIIRRGYGNDPNYIGVNVKQARSTLDGTPFATEVFLITEDADNELVLVNSRVRTPATTYRDWEGDVIDRGLVVQTQGNPVESTGYVIVQMNEHSVTETHNISTEFFEIANGDMRIGDTFHIYDPPAFTDTANPIYFRGEYMWPLKMRLLRASWPLTEGMGVYYRYMVPSGCLFAPRYIDLTPYVHWEANSHSLLQASHQYQTTVIPDE